MAQLSSLTEIHNYFLGFFCIESQVVAAAPCRQQLDFSPICGLIIPGDEAEHCCVVCKFYYMGGWGGSAAVICEKCVEKWAKHTTLGGPGVDGQSGGRVLAYPYVLCAVC